MGMSRGLVRRVRWLCLLYKVGEMSMDLVFLRKDHVCLDGVIYICDRDMKFRGKRHLHRHSHGRGYPSIMTNYLCHERKAGAYILLVSGFCFCNLSVVSISMT